MRARSSASGFEFAWDKHARSFLGGALWGSVVSLYLIGGAVLYYWLIYDA